MKKLSQLVHTLSYGDAISGETLLLQRSLRSKGIESEIYAINVHPKLQGAAIDYRDFQLDDYASSDSGVILHYSLGSPLNELYSSLTSAKRVLIYHNLTPARWFDGINPRIAADIEQGYRELPDLCAKSTMLIADSNFNAGELKQLGFHAEVLELPVDPARWTATSNPGITNLLKSDPAVHVLHVGRIAPNKCIEDIIKCFYFLHHHVNRNSKLWLVGIDTDTELYSFSLKRLVYELSLDHAVKFCGCMDDSEVRAMYENASVYLCMSEHEGFCLPVVEAMHFGLPVLSFASSALPDTIAEGGILFSEKRHPQLAELIQKISSDQEFRSEIIKAGKRRVAQLGVDRFESRLHQLLAQLQAGDLQVAAAAK